MTDFSDRQVRIQIKDQIDRMKRKKQLDEYEWSGSEDEGSSLDPPTVKKHGEGVCVWVWCGWVWVGVGGCGCVHLTASRTRYNAKDPSTQKVLKM